MANQFKALLSIPEVLKQGKALANVAAWKAHQVSANMIAAFLASVVALLNVGFDLNLGLTDDQLLSIGSGVLALYGMFNTFLTVATTDKIGIK